MLSMSFYNPNHSLKHFHGTPPAELHGFMQWISAVTPSLPQHCRVWEKLWSILVLIMGIQIWSNLLLNTENIWFSAYFLTRKFRICFSVHIEQSPNKKKKQAKQNKTKLKKPKPKHLKIWYAMWKFYPQFPWSMSLKERLWEKAATWANTTGKLIWGW